MPATTAAGGLSAWPIAAPTASIASREILRDFSIMMASYYFCAPAARCRDFRRRPQIPAKIDRLTGSSRRIISLDKDAYMLAYLDTLIGFAVVMLGASLLITILTQMASALFSHRGANLRWGLETMFQNMPNCPLLKANARQVAEDVLTHHLISDSIFSGAKWLTNRMKLATAVSPDELAAILQDLAARAGYLAIVPPGPPQPGVPAPTLAAEIIALLSVPNPSADRQIQLLTGEPNLAAVTAEVAPLLKDAVNSMRDAVGQLEAWFAATMDRVSTRFTTYARIWTIAFAVLFAAVTGMNSVTLISHLYSHGDFRQQMVGAAPKMIDLTTKVMPEGAKTA